MDFVVAGIGIALLLGLVVGAVTGRIQLRSCCGIADPAKDTRMRAAFIADSEHAPTPDVTLSGDLNPSQGEAEGARSHLNENVFATRRTAAVPKTNPRQQEEIEGAG